jgi:hypothetical protein
VQFLLQRRSENRLSGWIGYTFTQVRSRSYAVKLPPPLPIYGFDTPYAPTDQDQPHTVNIFGSYRLTPTIRVSAKVLYGSGFPLDANPFFPTSVQRIGPYERLDLRGEKSWTFNRWKLSFYTEILNVTAHDNRRLTEFGGTSPGFPFVPTAGLGFDF